MRPASGAPTCLISVSSSPATRPTLWLRKSFNDVDRDGERRAAQLGAEFESLERRKCFQRKLMQLDEEIVCPLPSDQRVMTQ